MSQYIRYKTDGVPVKAWVRDVLLDDNALQQLKNVAQLSIIHQWVAAMPDVHWGIGATIGSVIPTHKAIIPAAVGVDIGCGMMATQTTMTASDLPDDLKASVLGSRKRILFVEGDLGSLDAPIYGLLLPDTTVIPKGSSAHVMRAVDGLRTAERLHWVLAYGLVDRDDLTDDQVRELQDRGVFALSVHSAEAIYYSDAAMRRLARRQAETLGVDAEEWLNRATGAALALLSNEGTILRLSARRCERLVRGNMLSKIPTWRDIQSGFDISISVPVKDLYDQEVATYRVMIESRDLDGLISRYPVRESGALKEIATNLEFKGRTKYEQAVLALASAEGDFRHELRALVGPLASEINPDTKRYAVAADR